MKIASTLTISAPGETSLPSLLSSVSDTVLPQLGAPSLPVDDPSKSPSSQSLSSFDAMLAMFGLAPNLPLPSVPVPVVAQAAVPNAAPEIGSVVEPGAGPAASNLVALNNSLTPSLSLEAAALPNPTTSVLAAPTTDVTATTALATPVAAVPADQRQPIQKGVDAIEPQQQAAALIPTVSETKTNAQPESSSQSVLQTSKSLPSTEPQSHEPASLEEPASESKSLGRIEQATAFGATVIASEPASPHELVAAPQHFAELRPQVVEDKDHRHRHSTTNRSPASEAVNSVSHPIEVIGNGAKLIDSKSLSDQLTVAMQTHGQDLAAGKPIELQLRLDPPELGMVRVHLRMTENSVSVRFIAGDEAVTRMLESQLPDLRQSLAERGLSFVQCNVGSNSGNQSQSTFHHDPDQRLSVPSPMKGHRRQQSFVARQAVTSRAAGLDILV